MSNQHAKFLERLDGSQRGVWAFGYWLNSRGYTVEIPPIERAPSAAEHRNFTDNGDLFAWKTGGARLRIEVKTLGIIFSCREDWPFPEVFVSSVDSVHRTIEEVYAWVSVSNDLGVAAMIKATTWETWYKTTKLNRNTGNAEVYYAAPLEEVRFFSIKDA